MPRTDADGAVETYVEENECNTWQVGVNSRVRRVDSGGGQVTGGALLLCFQVLIAVTMDLCADQIMLGVLKIRSFNVCGIINKVITVFKFVGKSVASTARQCLAFRLKRGGQTRLAGIFSADLSVRNVVSFLVVILTRAIKL